MSSPEISDIVDRPGTPEIPCRICGVVFNIGRVRRLDEPPSSGWTATRGQRWHANPLRQDFQERPCQKEDGCHWTRRPLYWEFDGWHTSHGFDVLDDRGEVYVEEDDSDYIDDESSEYVEYEYESDDDLVEHLDEEDEEIDEAEPAYGCARYLVDPQTETPERLWVGNILLRNQDLSALNRLPRTLLLDSPYVQTGGPIDPMIRRHYEHIAGPNCQNRLGYNGNYITVEEMKGCNTIQFLLSRRDNWMAELHDQDFENWVFDPLMDECGLDEWSYDQFFVSGLCDVMPERHHDTQPRVVPARHGIERIDEDIAMPFHPTCFDILLRQWRMQFDSQLDVALLMRWLQIEVPMNNQKPVFPQMDHHPDVCRSYRERWDHHRGLEYLSANPLFVPRLNPILQGSIQKDPSFSTQFGAFDIPEHHLGRETGKMTSGDSFTLLPQELRLKILFHLDPRDIANLRLASRAFRQIPIYFWRHLVLQEMPWLWEARTPAEPYIWATVSHSLMEEEQKTKNCIEEQCYQYREVIGLEMPEMLSDWIAAEKRMLAVRPDVVAECHAEAKKCLMVDLPVDRTNWFQLYVDIKRHWDGLKGLQNRKRIWGEVEKLIDFLMGREFMARH